MKVLVIATHIDDEVLGCGGTIKKHTKAGDEVSVVFISSQSSKRFNVELINTRKSHAKKSSKGVRYPGDILRRPSLNHVRYGSPA